MNCARNIITANFSGGKTHATTARVYQWSRGIELCITGADNLPQTFKAHFSVQKRGGVATTIVGIDERVDVPNVLFTIGKDIHVWLGASETEDDAEILYTVDIPVAPAPMPEYYDAEDTGVFDAVVEQVADYAATATAAANSAGASATAAAGSASAAAQSAASIEGDVQIASQKASEAQTAAGQAVTAKEAAVTAQTAAETAATNAGQSASTATAKAAEAAQSASGAAQSKTDAEAAATRAEQAAATLTVDDALSDTSVNPVQNKVITAEVTQVKTAISSLDNFCRETVVETQTGVLNVTQGTVIPVATKIPFTIPADTDYHVTVDFPAAMFADGTIASMYANDVNDVRTRLQVAVQSGVQYTYHSTDAIQSLSFYDVASDVAQTGAVNITVQITTETVGSLESKINALEDTAATLTSDMDGIKDGLEEVSYTINSGYIGGTGIISPAGPNEEVYTDKIDVSQTDFLNISLTIPENKDMWLAVARYDSNESFISRVTLVNTVTQSSYNSQYTIPVGCAYVAFTYRTYGDAVFKLTEKWNVNGAWLTDGSVSVDKITADIFPSNTVKSIAHRGDDILAPQCTAPAYIYARKRGFTIAENDLWTSEDGYFVMWHDTSLSRLGNLVDINGYLMYTDGSVYYYVNPANNAVYTWSGTDYVASSVALSSLTRCAGANYGVNSTYNTIGLNLDVLKRIDFGVYKGAQFKGTQILTFEEWIVLCKKLGMDIYIDRKLSEYTTELITSAANIVKGLGMGDHASWLGLSVANIPVLRAIIPGARVGVLSHPTAASVEAYKDYKPGFFFNGDAKNGLTRESVQIGLNAGYDVETWYVGIESLTETEVLNFIETAIGYGVTAMTLDHYRVEDVTASLIA